MNMKNIKYEVIRRTACKKYLQYLTFIAIIIGGLFSCYLCQAVHLHEQSDASIDITYHSDTSSSTLLATSSSDSLPHHNRCEAITISICKNLPYNMTIMPNLIGHTKQEEAGMEVHQYAPLVKIGCSPDLQLFLCSLYVPVCTILARPIPPCRSLCESARLCETLVKTYNLNWPDNLECSRFPANNDEALCLVENTTLSIPSPTRIVPNVLTRKNYTVFESGTHRDIGFVCPVQLKTPQDLGYKLKVGGKDKRDCGAPCHVMFFSEKERTVLRYWVGSWAALCVASCLFTVLTFLIDSSRFRYPERAIVFLAICYLFVGCAYVAGLGAGDSVACREPFPPPVRLGRLQMISTIAQGHRQSPACTVVFMALYFCYMAAFAWWSCLAFAWFLAAGLKWGHEAIENKSHLFHFTAWAIPALQSISVLILGKVEGDILSGVCFVGQLNIYSLGIFLIIPLCMYLLIGALFLLAGFISLFRIRTVMKTDGKRTDKLERLMMRIGFFSGLFILPALAYLGCLFYEYSNLEDWMVQWHRDICKPFAIPCPVVNNSHDESRPVFQIYMIKYFSSMLVGVTSSVWLYSSKTLVTWKNFIQRLQGKAHRNPGQTYV